jgi:hypothetical protein
MIVSFRSRKPLQRGAQNNFTSFDSDHKVPVSAAMDVFEDGLRQMGKRNNYQRFTGIFLLTESAAGK